MNKIQWLQDGLLAAKLTTADKLSVFSENIEPEYSDHPEDQTIGLEYISEVFISEYTGKIAVLFRVLADVLNEIDPRRDVGKRKPKLTVVMLSPNVWDCRISIHFQEDQEFTEVAQGEHDIEINGRYYQADTEKPPSIFGLETIIKTNPQDQSNE